MPPQLERTPMHYAMGMSEVEVVGKILLQAGASRTVKDLVSIHEKAMGVAVAIEYRANCIK